MKDKGSFSKSAYRFPENFQEIPGIGTLLNPSNLANLHKHTREITPIWLEGIHFNIKRKYTPNVTCLLNWVLSHTNPSGVRVGCIYSPRKDDIILVKLNNLSVCVSYKISTVYF